MNVKALCDLMYRPEENPLQIRIGYGDMVAIDNFNINDPFHMALYGKFKVENFRALGDDVIEIALARTDPQPIIEE